MRNPNALGEIIRRVGEEPGGYGTMSTWESLKKEWVSITRCWKRISENDNASFEFNEINSATAQNFFSSYMLYLCWWFPCLSTRNTKRRTHSLGSFRMLYSVWEGIMEHLWEIPYLGLALVFLYLLQVYSLPFSAWLCLRRLTPVDWAVSPAS